MSSRRSRLVATLLALIGLLAASTGLAPAGAQSIDDKRAEAAQIADRVDELDAQAMELGAQAEAANYELSQIQAEAEAAKQQADEANAELAEREQELRAYSIGAYVSGNDTSSFDAILRSDADSAPAKQGYLEAAAGDRRDHIDRLSAARQKAETAGEELAATEAEAKAKADEIDAALDEASDAADQKRALLEQTEGELAELVAAESARRAEAAAAAAAAATTTTAPGATAGTTGTTGAPGRPAAAPAAGGGAPAPAPAPKPSPAPDPGPAPAPSGNAAAAIGYATSKVGSPYVWGAEGPNAFDCSGLMVWAFRQIGISLPHYSGAQYSMTTRVSRSQLAPGDLVFWGGGGSEHVALYMGGNQIVHAFGSAGGTRITNLDGWWKTPSGYGRL